MFRRDERYCVSFWNNAAIVDLRGDLDSERVRGLGKAYHALSESHPAGIVVLVLVRPSVPVSSGDVMSELVRMIKSLGDALVQLVTVIEDRGLLAQLMRSLTRGLNVLVKKARITSADTIDEGIRLLAPHLTTPLPRKEAQAELQAAILTMRETYDQWCPRH